MEKSTKSFSGPAEIAAAKKAGLNVKKSTGYAAFEKKDKAADKKAGVKEGSKKDMAMDKKAGMPAFKRGGKVGGCG